MRTSSCPLESSISLRAWELINVEDRMKGTYDKLAGRVGGLLMESVWILCDPFDHKLRHGLLMIYCGLPIWPSRIL